MRRSRRPRKNAGDENFVQPPGLDTADNGSQKEVFEKSATLFDSVLSFSNCIASLLRSARIAASSSLFAEASAMRSSTTRRDLQPLSREVLPIFWKMFANVLAQLRPFSAVSVPIFCSSEDSRRSLLCGLLASSCARPGRPLSAIFSSEHRSLPALCARVCRRRLSLVTPTYVGSNSTI